MVIQLNLAYFSTMFLQQYLVSLLHQVKSNQCDGCPFSPSLEGAIRGSCAEPGSFKLNLNDGVKLLRGCTKKPGGLSKYRGFRSFLAEIDLDEHDSQILEDSGSSPRGSCVEDAELLEKFFSITKQGRVQYWSCIVDPHEIPSSQMETKSQF